MQAPGQDPAQESAAEGEDADEEGVPGVDEDAMPVIGDGGQRGEGVEDGEHLAGLLTTALKALCIEVAIRYTIVGPMMTGPTTSQAGTVRRTLWTGCGGVPLAAGFPQHTAAPVCPFTAWPASAL